MKSKYHAILLAALTATALPSRTSAQEVSLTVSNPCDIQRQEVIEADLLEVCSKLGTDSSSSIRVTNALGQEVTYQKSHDGKLLLCVSLQPNSETTYTVRTGKPSPFRRQVYGKIYPERLDDLTWENDRGIYRMYGPALQTRGEKSYGTDIWVKNTPELVVEERYRMHMQGWQQGDSLKKAGKKKEGEEVFRNASFHLDHGYGMDVYSVGPTMGCGAPALMKDGKLVFPYCFKECRILDNGPLRFTASLTYGTTEEGITEHRLITLDKGSHYNRMTVWYDGISQPLSLAAGVVLHDNGKPVTDKDCVLYADPTDNPKVHQSQIYVGTLFPEGVDETTLLAGKPGHAVGIVRQYRGEPYTYYFGSAWSNYDVRTLSQWKLMADEYLLRLRHMPTVRVTVNSTPH